MSDFLDRLLVDWERRQRMEAVAAAMSTSILKEPSYRIEAEEWEITSADGLDGQ